ncbi:PEP-CTERM sorting domain-containing protein [Verrucomicrobia bacterium S94]|nr:PEP-CTERM sorting domain-containing protein [Verrucomicrobia bacterium S94]
MKTTVTFTFLLFFCTTSFSEIFTLDLNSPNQFTDNFQTSYTGTPVSQQSDGGLGGSGSIDFTSGDGTQGWYTKFSFDPIDVGGSLSLSYAFQYHDNDEKLSSVSGVKIGFCTDPTSPSNQYGMPSSGLLGDLGMWSWGNAILSSDSSGMISGGLGNAISMTDYGWYEIGLALSRTADTTYDITYSFWSLNDDGEKDTQLGFNSGTPYDSSKFNTTLYAFLALENPTATATFNALDNITLSSTGTINDLAIPEPSSLTLAGFICAFAFFIRRRMLI